MSNLIEILNKHLEEVGAKPKCPICGSSSWSEETGTFVLNKVEGDTIEPNKGMIVIPLECSKCGYIHLFSEKVIENEKNS